VGPDVDAIEQIARALADRETVDWESALSDASGDDRTLIGRIRRIDALTSSFRSVSADRPSLRPGDGWGALRIDERIGEGSFGEVYRAWDARLHREVALKLLREDEPGNSRRDGTSSLVEEGRLLARVRHSNVVTVFGADQVNGRTGIWMEFVPGQTLEQELRVRGPFQPSDVAAVGRDVCRALEAVHRAGMLHRDIKAQNVIRDPDGRVVLMDFGTGREPAATGDDGAKTAGTPLYIAPELFEGATGSVASEIYSVGVLLHHLATGAYPVEGRTLADVRAAHREGRSTSVHHARPDLPRDLALTIDRALSRDPSARFDSAADMAAALDRVVASRGWRHFAAWALGTIAVAVLVAVIWPRSPSALLAQPPVQRFRLPVDGNGVGDIALSADGTRLAYIRHIDHGDELVVRSLGEFVGSTIYAGRVLSSPFFSPNGRWIGFSEGQSQLGINGVQKISIDGGPVTRLAAVGAGGGARWRRDGSIVLASRNRLWTIPETGGTPLLLNVALAAGQSLIQPDVLDDGTLLVTDRRQGLPDRLALVSVRGELIPLEDNATNGRYSPNGYLLFVRDRAIVARPFDANRHEATGPAVRVGDSGFASEFEISATGTLVYRTIPPPGQSGLGAVWATRGTITTTPLPIPIDDYRPFAWRLSPDDAHVFVALPHPRDVAVTGKLHSTVWTGDASTGVLSQLTFDDSIPVAWSADGQSVTIKMAENSLRQAPLDRSTEGSLLVPPQQVPLGNRGTSSPNGSSLVLQSGGNDGSIDLWSVVIPREGHTGPPAIAPFANSPFNEFSPAFSPDGRWVAYQSDDTGRNEIYIRPYPGPGPQIQISEDGGSNPRWRGGEIFYGHPDQGGKPMIMAAAVDTAGPPRVVTTSVALRFVEFAAFDVTSDGRRFLLLSGKQLRPTQLDLVLNWPSLVSSSR